MRRIGRPSTVSRMKTAQVTSPFSARSHSASAMRWAFSGSCVRTRRSAASIIFSLLAFLLPTGAPIAHFLLFLATTELAWRMALPSDAPRSRASLLT